MTTAQVHAFESTMKQFSLTEALIKLCAQFPERVTFSTSFGMEDQLITHFIAVNQLPIRIFTLDTGRLFPETYSLWSATLEKYPITIEAFYPDATELGKYVSTFGPNAFYASVDNRKECCRIRKVVPLRRALEGYAVWITGIRSAQSAERSDMPMLEWDPVHQLLKFHPLLHMTTEELHAQVRKWQIPYNSLHDKGFVSIGCAPCTRAVKPGEDLRAGRWWWESGSKKECGLHLHGQ